jgi:hypothetical protein
MTVDGHRDAAEEWFRRRGLPLVIHGSTRGRDLIARTVPALVFLIVLAVIGVLLVRSIDPDAEGAGDEAALEPAEGMLVLVAAVVVAAVLYLALPGLFAWLARKALRGRSRRVQLVAGGITIAVAVTLVPALAAGDGDDSFLVGVVVAATTVAVVLLLARCGVGAILVWAVRKAAQQINSIGTMASRVLPLLLLVVMFAFFTGELWQAADALSRRQLWIVVAFLGLLAAGFMATTFSDEFPALRAASRARTDLQTRLQATPLAGSATAAEHTPLSRAEQLNLVLVLFLAQAVQVVAFAGVVFVFFVLFGVLMITPGVQATYLGVPHPAGATVLGLPFPVSNALFQVSLFLAAFSGLYFTASKTTDERYRKAFFDPLIDEIALSLAARNVYRERWPSG